MPKTVLAFGAGMKRFSLSARTPLGGPGKTVQRTGPRDALAAYQAMTPRTMRPKPPNSGTAAKVLAAKRASSIFVLLVIGFLIPVETNEPVEIGVRSAASQIEILVSFGNYLDSLPAPVCVCTDAMYTFVQQSCFRSTRQIAVRSLPNPI